jgi:hypothetical protein
MGRVEHILAVKNDVFPFEGLTCSRRLVLISSPFETPLFRTREISLKMASAGEIRFTGIAYLADT